MESSYFEGGRKECKIVDSEISFQSSRLDSIIRTVTIFDR